MSPVTLTPISDETYRLWLADAVKDYADDKIAAGTWAADRALELSQQEFNHLLPHGPATANSFIYGIRADGKNQDIGVVWISIVEWGGVHMAFIYDIIVFEPFRRQGFGRAALIALEDKVRRLGVDQIGLHVFGHNRAARELYEKVGYMITDINMVKKLD
jgi:ribosomal protein S18 acetylase RimI-like enzyme